MRHCVCRALPDGDDPDVRAGGPSGCPGASCDGDARQEAVGRTGDEPGDYEWRLSQGDPLDLPRDRTTDPLSTVLGSLVGSFSVLTITWMVILGFVGGTVPVTGWELPGRSGGRVRLARRRGQPRRDRPLVRPADAVDGPVRRPGPRGARPGPGRQAAPLRAPAASGPNPIRAGRARPDGPRQGRTTRSSRWMTSWGRPRAGRWCGTRPARPAPPSCSGPGPWRTGGRRGR